MSLPTELGVVASASEAAPLGGEEIASAPPELGIGGLDERAAVDEDWPASEGKTAPLELDAAVCFGANYVM